MRAFIFMLSFFILISIVGFLSYFNFYPVIDTVPGMQFLLKTGTTAEQAVNQLSKLGIVLHPKLFSLWIRLRGTATQLKAGEYLFPQGASLKAIWLQLVEGTGLIYHPFAIIPGWTFTQLREALMETEGLKHQMLKWNDQKIMQSLGYAPTLSPEGQFFAETYFYTYGQLDIRLLQQASLMMQQKLNDAWNHRADHLPYQNAQEALIAASLVEREAYLDTERAVIAGVLVNRLKKGMLLQFDPTVIYGLGGGYSGKLRKTDLMIDSAYNTYRHAGLPP